VPVESSSLLTKLSQIPVLGRVSLLGSTLVAGKVLSEATSGFQEGKVICVFRNVTGLPCPFCGGTRSVGSALSGDLAEAWSFNPLGLVALVLFSLALLNPSFLGRVTELISRKWWRIPYRAQIFTIIGVNVVAWILNLPRML
jgi:Protein of unknown function (DUF2752)